MSFNPNITVDIVNNNLDKNGNHDFLKINYGRNGKYFFENNYYKKYEITLELYENYENIKYYEKKYGYKINYSLLSENSNTIKSKFLNHINNYDLRLILIFISRIVEVFL